MPPQNNDSSFWRAYEERTLTHSAAHYLTAIARLRQRHGYARVTDVAAALRISRGAASRAITQLKERGWIGEDPRRMLELTEPGAELARGVEHNYQVIQCFLEEVLGVAHEVACEDACKLEHLCSAPTIGALLSFIRTLEGNLPLRGRLQEWLRAALPMGTDPAPGLFDQPNAHDPAAEPPAALTPQRKDFHDSCPPNPR
jgi:Mn-dependent DtxR family transcriptional regulator